MKTLPITLLSISVAFVAGTYLFIHRQDAPAPSATTAKISPEQPRQAPMNPQAAAENHENPQMNIERVPAPETIPAALPVPVPASVDLAPARPSAPHSQAGDALISAQTSFANRQALLRQLKSLGGLDGVIAELKLRAAENPNDPQIPTALGEALMNKFPFKDHTEMATIGLQIDQSFNAALKLDPTHWEAQFSKAAALAVWPAEMKTGPEVIQRLTTLIDQQEAMTPQPHFAQTYVLLGEQYQKAGQACYAVATWKLGLERFRNDKALLQHLAAH